MMFDYKRVTVCLLAAALVISPLSVAAGPEQELSEPSAFNTFIDAALYRPIGLILIPIGAGVFVLSLPFSSLGGNVSKSYDNLVVAPVKYTFNRPLGEIN